MNNTFREFRMNYKNRFISTLGTFCIIAFILFFIIPFVGTISLSSDSFINVFAIHLFSVSTYSTIEIVALASIIFSIFYSIRNTHAQLAIYGVTKKNHFLSTIAVGATYSALFAIVSFLCELIILMSLFNNSKNQILINEYYFSFINSLTFAVTVFFITIAIFSGTFFLFEMISKKHFVKASIPFIFAGIILLGYIATEYYSFLFNPSQSWIGKVTSSIIYTIAICLCLLFSYKKGGIKK